MSTQTCLSNLNDYHNVKRGLWSKEGCPHGGEYGFVGWHNEQEVSVSKSNTRIQRYIIWIPQKSCSLSDEQSFTICSAFFFSFIAFQFFFQTSQWGVPQFFSTSSSIDTHTAERREAQTTHTSPHTSPHTSAVQKLLFLTISLSTEPHFQYSFI